MRENEPVRRHETQAVSDAEGHGGFRIDALGQFQRPEKKLSAAAGQFVTLGDNALEDFLQEARNDGEEIRSYLTQIVADFSRLSA